MVKVSVIIPAYNAEKYIQRAIESAVKQTLKDKEIIVIVDGATDNTLSLVEDFSKIYQDVFYYYIENSGLSVARNTGVSKARGEYIAFLDADDFFVDNTVLEVFYEKSIKNNLDVIRGAYKIFNEKENCYIPHYAPSFPKINQVIGGKEFLCSSMKYHFNEVVAWLGLYKRDFLLNEGIKFIKGIYYEDQPFLLDVLFNEKLRIMQTDTYFYVYVKRAGTITSSLSYKHAEDMARVIQKEFEILNSKKIDRKTRKSALKYISSGFYQITTVYGHVDKSLRKKCVSLIPFKTRVKLMHNAYNSYHFKKIFLFNFARVILNWYYDRSKNV